MTYAEHLKIIVDDFLGIDISDKSKKQEYSDGRKLFVVLCHQLMIITNDYEISELLKFHISNVIRNRKKGLDLLETDEDFNEKYKSITLKTDELCR